MNWRKWLYEQLVSASAVTTLVPVPSIMAAGSLEGSPKNRPFILIRVGDEIPEMRDGGIPVASSRSAAIWVYDEPGSYDLIDDILAAVRRTLTGPLPSFSGYPSGITAEWSGDSIELADDMLSAITRNGTYRLVGAVT